MWEKTALGRVKLQGDEGAFTAVIATLNVIDKQNDVILPGAFTDGEQVRVCQWGHRSDALPVGKGEVYTLGDEAVCRGRFFIDTAAGAEHYRVVRDLGPLQEWSFAYDIVDSNYGEFRGKRVRFLKKLKVIEVSPVLQGAGINTRTLDVKRYAPADWRLRMQLALLEAEIMPKSTGDSQSPARLRRELDIVLLELRVKGLLGHEPDRRPTRRERMLASLLLSGFSEMLAHAEVDAVADRVARRLQRRVGLRTQPGECRALAERWLGERV